MEVGALFRACVDNDGNIPRRFLRLPYIVIRVALALAAGALAVVFEPKTALMALYIGASAPVLIDKLSQGAMPSLPPSAAPPAPPPPPAPAPGTATP